MHGHPVLLAKSVVVLPLLFANIRYMDCCSMEQWMLFVSCIYYIPDSKKDLSEKDPFPISCMHSKEHQFSVEPARCDCKLHVHRDSQSRHLLLV